MSERECVWTMKFDGKQASAECGGYFNPYSSRRADAYMGPNLNRPFQFCPYCGKKLVARTEEEKELEDERSTPSVG